MMDISIRSSYLLGTAACQNNAIPAQKGIQINATDMAPAMAASADRHSAVMATLTRRVTVTQQVTKKSAIRRRQILTVPVGTSRHVIRLVCVISP